MRKQLAKNIKIKGHWYFRTQVYYFHTTSKFVRSKRPNNLLNFYFFSLFLFLCSLSSLFFLRNLSLLSEKWVVGLVEGGQQRLVKDARSRGLRCHVGCVRHWRNQKSRGVAVAAHADGGASLCRQCRVWGDLEWIFVRDLDLRRGALSQLVILLMGWWWCRWDEIFCWKLDWVVIFWWVFVGLRSVMNGDVRLVDGG